MSRSVSLGVGVLLIVYAVLFVRYAVRWHSDQALWSYARTVTPTNPLTVSNAIIASRMGPSQGFVFEDPTWTEACGTWSVAQQWRGLRGIPRSLAQSSWCWQQGQSAGAFRIVNLLIHSANAFLLGLVLYQVTDSRIVSAIAAALFAVHPLTVESAVYLAGRGELIAGFGVLLASLLVLQDRWLLAALAFVVGVTGKESAIVALVTVPLVLYVMARLKLSVALAMAILLPLGILALTLSVNLIDLSMGERLGWALVQATAAVRLTLLAIVPVGLTPTHDFAFVPMLAEVGCLALMAGCARWAWTRRHDAPLVTCGVLWILATVLPRLVVPTPPSVLNEHQFYVPLMGFSFLAAHYLQVWSAV